MLKGSLMAKIAVSPLVSARLYQPILSSDPYQEPRCFSNPKTFGSWLRPVRFLRREWFEKRYPRSLSEPAQYTTEGTLDRNLPCLLSSCIANSDATSA